MRYIAHALCRVAVFLPCRFGVVIPAQLSDEENMVKITEWLDILTRAERQVRRFTHIVALRENETT
jgi:hypothetical protein